MKVTAREGHHPISPGFLPSASRRRQYSVFFTASFRMPLVVKSKAATPPALSIQSHRVCLGPFWL